MTVVAASLTAQAVTAQLGIADGRAREAVFDSFVSGAVSIAGNAEVVTVPGPDPLPPAATADEVLAREFLAQGVTGQAG